MPVVTLRAVLRDLAGGARDVRVEGQSVGEALKALERAHPPLTGWILDEQGRIRRHVNVFVGGERSREETSVGPDDVLHVLSAISGGDQMTELLVGTKKGLFVLLGNAPRPFEVAHRAFPGEVVEFALRDPRSGRYFASVTSGFYGPRLMLADDPAGEWRQARGLAFPEDVEASAERIWVVTPAEEADVLYAGTDPAALWRSEDGGETWELNRGLWNVPTRPDWHPGAGGLALHSIVPWPGQPDRLAVGISAAGVWLTDDRGESWHTGYTGLVAGYLPEEAREGTHTLCVHSMRRAPLRPSRLFMQFHGSVYRSDDEGETWLDVSTGLPSGFGFPVVLDPVDPDAAYVIPLTADVDRVTPEGSVRVYETRDGGGSWVGRGDGLPTGDAYLTVLRQAFDADGGSPLGLYFGATSGDVFGSSDGGATWFEAATRIAPVTSVRVASA